MIYSDYAEAAFYIAMSLAALFTLLFLVAFLFLCSATFTFSQDDEPGTSSRSVERSQLRLAGVCGFVATIFLSVMFATFSGFGLISPGISILFCAVAWGIMSPLISFLFGTTAIKLFSRPLISHVIPKSEDELKNKKLEYGYEAPLLLTLPQNSEAKQRHGKFEEEEEKGEEMVELGLISKNGDLRPRGYESIPQTTKKIFVLFWQRIFFDIRKSPKTNITVFVVGMLLSSFFILAMFRTCSCSQPTELTTWLTRQLTSPRCKAGEICSVYPLVGGNCSELIIVAHFIAQDGASGSAPKRMYVDICRNGTSDCQNPKIFYGSIHDMADIDEDRRYVGRAIITSLLPATIYKVVVTFELNSRAIVSNYKSPLMARSLPSCSSNATAASSGEVDVIMVGGGDYQIGEDPGRKILKAMMAAAPNADFYYLDGDLAYANNMRSCYRRWDEVLYDWITLLRRPDGSNIPWVFAVGNHEGGGYLHAKTREERMSRFAFYQIYFPHPISSHTMPFLADIPNAPAPTLSEVDDSLSFHSHSIGAKFSLVILDSDIMLPAKQQIAFARVAMDALLKEDRVLVPMYHNPAYPSVRDYDEVISVSMRKYFVPLFDEYAANIPFALEAHDHVYKRTFPLRNSEVVNNSQVEEKSQRGIPYIGDGCLGVYSGREIVWGRWYLQVGRESNYFHVATVHHNKTIFHKMYAEDGVVFDQFATHP